MESKKKRIISIIALIALALTIIAATYAYFNAQNGDPAAADIKINANTVDTLTFATGNQISFTINQENFASGTGNQTSSTYASALLTANNKTNTATEHYYLYLNIENNTFTYSIDESAPEIIMTVTDSSGTEIADISTLTHVIATGADGKEVSGYDITNKSGLITLFNNREIRATPSKEEKWNVTITFVNYDQNQKANAGMSMSANLIIRKNKFMNNISQVCDGGEKLSDCIISLSEKSVAGTTNVYHHDANLANGAGDNSYRYAGSSEGHPDYYSCKYDGNDVWNFENDVENQTLKGNCSKVYKIVLGEDTYYYDKSFENYFYTTIPVKWDNTNNKCLTSTNKEVFAWYENEVTEKECTGIAYQYKDKDYYYIGITEVGEGTERLVEFADSGVNNFVCFGSTASPCPTDNLYRIIGVFNGKVKLIKYDYANSNLLGTDGDYIESKTPNDAYYKGFLTSIDKYYWNYKNDTTIKMGSIDWSKSLLNKINLNTNFINNLGEQWTNKITPETWKIGGNTWENIAGSVPAVTYQNEIVNPASTNSTGNVSEYNAKIGLMYVSDYGYAGAPSQWTKTIDSYYTTLAETENWMFMGFEEWSLTPCYTYSDFVFYLRYYGYFDGTDARDRYGVRPVFYLKDSVAYAGGSGTKDSPITLEI